MNYKPPYWYHDNIKFSPEEIEKLKDDIENIHFDGVKDNSNLSTYFLDETKRPEIKYNDLYSNIVENITKNVGIYYKVKYRYGYWSQLYKKGMLHLPHHHASLDSKLDSIISWVHFLDVPDQKCFRFTDMKGSYFFPEEQNTGDIICFPSWLWHEVVPNESDKKRLVVSGNITITHYDRQ